MAPPLRKTLRGPGPSLPGPGPGSLLLRADTIPRAYLVSPNADRTTGGSTVTIKGYNFFTGSLGEKPTVKFGTILGTGLTLVDLETITVVVPAGAEGLVDITVTNPNGQTAVISD